MDLAAAMEGEVLVAGEQTGAVPGEAETLDLDVTTMSRRTMEAEEEEDITMATATTSMPTMEAGTTMQGEAFGGEAPTTGGTAIVVGNTRKPACNGKLWSMQSQHSSLTCNRLLDGSSVL